MSWPQKHKEIAESLFSNSEDYTSSFFTESFNRENEAKLFRKLKKKYLSLAIETHPDKNKDEQATINFQALNQTWLDFKNWRDEQKLFDSDEDTTRNQKDASLNKDSKLKKRSSTTEPNGMDVYGTEYVDTIFLAVPCHTDYDYNNENIDSKICLEPGDTGEHIPRINLAQVTRVINEILEKKSCFAGATFEEGAEILGSDNILQCCVLIELNVPISYLSQVTSTSKSSYGYRQANVSDINFVQLNKGCSIDKEMILSFQQPFAYLAAKFIRGTIRAKGYNDFNKLFETSSHHPVGRIDVTNPLAIQAPTQEHANFSLNSTINNLSENQSYLENSRAKVKKAALEIHSEIKRLQSLNESPQDLITITDNINNYLYNPSEINKNKLLDSKSFKSSQLTFGFKLAGLLVSLVGIIVIGLSVAGTIHTGGLSLAGISIGYSLVGGATATAAGAIGFFAVKEKGLTQARNNAANASDQQQPSTNQSLTSIRHQH